MENQLTNKSERQTKEMNSDYMIDTYNPDEERVRRERQGQREPGRVGLPVYLLPERLRELYRDMNVKKGEAARAEREFREELEEYFARVLPRSN